MASDASANGARRGAALSRGNQVMLRTGSARAPLSVSNQAVLRSQLRVSVPSDSLEREAEALADRAMERPVDASSVRSSPSVQIQRTCARCDDDERLVQRSAHGKAKPYASAAIVQDIGGMRGGGTPLPADTRAFMEQRLGHDFSNVRVHAGSQANKTTRALAADAFTVGNDIFFARGTYDPQSAHGQRLLAHELVHVTQQADHSDFEPLIVQRAATRGAGGCGPLYEVDEDESGTRAAGTTAHRQIQRYLLSEMIFSELPVPRATKRAIDNLGCQPAGTDLGYEDLYRPGNITQLAEIKPFPSASSRGVEEVTHYIRRADQSVGRLYVGSRASPCGDVGPGDDDREFARDIGASRLVPPVFTRLTGIFPADTVLGSFDGDPDRTLKARLVAPGAVGYWCTGGGADTFTCGASEHEMNQLIDRALVPAQDALEEVLGATVRQQVSVAVGRMSVRDLFAAVRRVIVPRLESALGADLSMVLAMLPGNALDSVADFLDAQIGPQIRGLVRTLAQVLIDRILTELRLRLRAMLRELLRDALLAVCVGAPIVTLAMLMDQLRRQLRERSRQLVPVLVGAVVAAFVVEVAAQMFAQLVEWSTALANAATWVIDKIARVLAVVAMIIVAAAIIVVGVLFVLSIFDPVPGDEVALGAAEGGLASLMPVLLNFIRTGLSVAPALAPAVAPR